MVHNLLNMTGVATYACICRHYLDSCYIYFFLKAGTEMNKEVSYMYHAGPVTYVCNTLTP